MIDAKKNRTKNFKRLMRRISKKEKGALEAFYSYYGKIIKATAYQICKKREDVNEVVNDVLLKVWKAAHNVKELDIQNPEGWVYTVTANAAKTHQSKIKEYALLDEQLPAFPALDNDLTSNDDFLYIISILSDIEKQIMILKFLCHSTFEEISVEEHKPVSTISSIYYRALEKLKNNSKKSE
ncbi:MAG: sigma-70 family RNA polymerase sigma factor [Clostridia bacterium]|nr:sigma-70 family RNA polymerase sigma factor [Clostridia bacterium]